ncbi:MAG TPA: choice-of-anchor tandem repeat NxxGxxAF-containing protein [Phycisphaerae bacterium]|nr:choice-of-anchor tandem repeat NxxGxxAF-containing protein [Phycisphaerae bacterium]
MGRVFWAVPIVFIASAAKAQLSLRTVAMTGDPCPRSSLGGVISNFTNLFSGPSQRINNSGRVAFQATCSDTGETMDLTEGHGSLQAIRVGDVVPGLGALTTVLAPAIDDDGDILFLGVSSHDGYVTDQTGSLTKVVATGDLVPGMGTTRFQTLSWSPGVNSSPSIGHGGQGAFYATITGNGVGVWTHQSGALATAAIQGVAVPNYPGETFGLIDGSLYPTVNAHGDTAFKAGAAWMETNGAYRRISPTVQEDPANCQPTASPSINNAGRASYVATCAGISGQPQRILSEAGGTLHMVATSTDPPVGMPAGSTYAGMSPPGITGVGQTVFHSSVITPDQQTRDAYFAEDVQGLLKVLVAEGMPVPGMSSDVTFDLVPKGTPSANALGHVVFSASMIGPGVSARGIWLSEISSGALSLLLGSGQMIEVRPGDLRQVSDLVYFSVAGNGPNEPTRLGSGGQDGLPTPLNDNDQFVFKAIFTDGSSGIFVATIPEPGGVGLMGLILLAFIRRRIR